jgi:hypothetical protein
MMAHSNARMIRHECLSLTFAVTCLLACSGLAQSPPSYIIRGKVLDVSGRAMPGVRVCAHPVKRQTGEGSMCAGSDPRGNFVIRPRASGEYQVVASKEGYVAPLLPFFRHPEVPTTETIIDESNPDVSVSITMPPKNGALSGRAVDGATNLPIERVDFVMCHVDSPQTCFRVSAKDANGRFRVATPHVPFILSIVADGYEDWFGLGGSGKADRMFVDSDTTTELHVYLRRRMEATAKALNDAEKLPGVYLAAPAQLSPGDNAEFNYFPRATTLEWAPLEGAVSYAVEVDYCQGGGKNGKECVSPQPLVMKGTPAAAGITDTTYKFTFLGAQPGRWRVWAVDKDGREGFKSPWRKFVYLR